MYNIDFNTSRYFFAPISGVIREPIFSKNFMQSLISGVCLPVFLVVFFILSKHWESVRAITVSGFFKL